MYSILVSQRATRVTALYSTTASTSRQRIACLSFSLSVRTERTNSDPCSSRASIQQRQAVSHISAVQATRPPRAQGEPLLRLREHKTIWVVRIRACACQCARTCQTEYGTVDRRGRDEEFRRSKEVSKMRGEQQKALLASRVI